MTETPEENHKNIMKTIAVITRMAKFRALITVAPELSLSPGDGEHTSPPDPGCRERQLLELG